MAPNAIVHRDYVPYGSQVTRTEYGTAPPTGYVAEPAYGYVAQPSCGYVAEPTYIVPRTYGYVARPPTGYVAEPAYGYVAQPSCGYVAEPRYVVRGTRRLSGGRRVAGRRRLGGYRTDITARPRSIATAITTGPIAGVSRRCSTTGTRPTTGSLVTRR